MLRRTAAVLAPLPQTNLTPNPPRRPVHVQPKPDPVADLIANAEKEYQAGEDKFKAGDLEAAKRNFDHAVDMLLQSPAEIRSDERVQHELERVLEGVNRPEMAALQSDNPAPQQKAEPAPIDEANDVTPPVDPNVKARAEAEIKAHPFRSAADADRPGGGLHQLFFHPRVTRSCSMRWSAAAVIAK